MAVILGVVFALALAFKDDALADLRIDIMHFFSGLLVLGDGNDMLLHDEVRDLEQLDNAILTLVKRDDIVKASLDRAQIIGIDIGIIFRAGFRGPCQFANGAFGVVGLGKTQDIVLVHTDVAMDIILKLVMRLTFFQNRMLSPGVIGDDVKSVCAALGPPEGYMLVGNHRRVKDILAATEIIPVFIGMLLPCSEFGTDCFSFSIGCFLMAGGYCARGRGA